MILQARIGALGFILCICGILVLGISGSVILIAEDEAEQTKFNVSGLMAAVLTSLNDDNTVNLDGIPEYVDYLISNGIKSALVGGSSGEHMFLSVKDRKSIIDAWMDASVGADLHIQVQVGGAPFVDVVDLTAFCSRKGVHYILSLPDLYAKPKTVDELVDYVELVAKAAPNTPVFYYHIPKKTHVEISMPDFVEAATARIPNFYGIKFTHSNLIEAAKVLSVLQDHQKFFLGGEYLLAPAALLGIDSCASPAINLFPGLMQNILDAVENGYIVKAREWQEKLSDMVNEISEEGGRIPAMKVAMEILTGIKMGPPALPAKPVTSEARKRIEEKLRKFNS